MLVLSSGLFCGGDSKEVCHICAITFPRRRSLSHLSRGQEPYIFKTPALRRSCLRGNTCSNLQLGECLLTPFNSYFEACVTAERINPDIYEPPPSLSVLPHPSRPILSGPLRGEVQSRHAAVSGKVRTTLRCSRLLPEPLP